MARPKCGRTNYLRAAVNQPANCSSSISCVRPSYRSLIRSPDMKSHIEARYTLRTLVDNLRLVPRPARTAGATLQRNHFLLIELISRLDHRSWGSVDDLGAIGIGIRPHRRFNM